MNRLLWPLVLLPFAVGMDARCGGPDVRPRSTPSAQYETLRDEVRSVARPACGSCHTSGLATAKPDALAAFDLARERWAEGLDPDQLDFFVERIEGEVSPDDYRTVRRFVAAAKAEH